MNEKTISSFDGTKIHYQILKNSGPYLFLLHGGSGSSHSWCFQVPFLTQAGYSLVVLDQRGHGLSGRGKTLAFFDVTNYARDIKAIYEEENISQAVLVGHSYGGQIIQKFYELFPNQVTALVFISTKFDYSAGLIGWVTNLIMSVIFFFGRAGEPNNNYTDYKKFKNSADLNPVRILRDIKCCSFKTYAATIILGNNFRNNNYKEIKVPSLLIHGKNDIIMPHKQAEAVSREMPNFELVSLPTNHITLLNTPDEINLTIDKFVKNLKF